MSNQQQQAPQLPKNPLQLPTSDRDQAACRRCHRILTITQWIKEGCKNCNDGAVSRAELKEKTTQLFYGHVGIVDSRSSWIARLIGVDGAPSGVYAARVAAENNDDNESRPDE
jgi:RNA polymerase subunit RPABC4/transcription elongation factor Spt4